MFLVRWKRFDVEIFAQDHQGRDRAHEMRHLQASICQAAEEDSIRWFSPHSLAAGILAGLLFTMPAIRKGEISA